MVTDLSQLFELNPYVASGFMGQRESMMQGDQRLAQQKTLQDLMAAKQRMQFEADAHPMDLEKLMLANQQTRAQIPGFEADSRKKGLEADLKAGTLQTDIEEGNSKNRTEIYKRLGGHLGSLASALEGVSDMEAPMVLSQGLDSLGAPPQIKQGFMQRYGRLPAKEAAKRMQDDADRILRETPAYAQAYDTTSLTQDAHILTNAATNASNERRAEADRQAGKFDRQRQVQSASDQWADSVRKAQGAAKKYAAANAAAEFFRQNGELGEAQKWAAIAAELEPQARAELTNTQQGKPGGIAVGEVTGLPTNPAASITPPSRAASAPAPAANRDPMAQQAIQAWGAYEPNKYEYRMFNGKLQRKAK